MRLKKKHRISHVLSAYNFAFGMQTANKNPLKRLCFSGFPNLSFSKCGATSTIKVKSLSIHLDGNKY